MKAGPSLAAAGRSGYPSLMEESLKKRFENNPLAQAILKEGLAIQDRFSAEPVYAKTGKGSLRSVGVTETEAAEDRVNRRGSQA